MPKLPPASRMCGVSTCHCADHGAGSSPPSSGVSESFVIGWKFVVMDGFIATKILRKKEIDTPIIALTAHAMNGDRERCIEAGCDDYLSKPIDRDMLLEILSKYLPVKVRS